MVVTRQQLPNLLTLSRGLATAGAIALFFSPLPARFTIVLALVLYATLTDLLDGALARRWHAVSAFGKVFDPLLDKILVLTLLVLLYPFNLIPPLAVVILLVRDVAIDTVKAFMLQKTGVTTPAIRSAKWKTALQLMTIHAAVAALVWPAAWLPPLVAGLAWLAVGCSLYSAAVYLTRFRRALDDGRAG